MAVISPSCHRPTGALLPLLLYKSSIPGTLYASLMVFIHVIVLAVYLYKVRWGMLDVDRLSLGGRILGLVVMVWLLTVVAGWQDHAHVRILAMQMMVLCAVHTIVLGFLMVAVVHSPMDINIGNVDADYAETNSIDGSVNED